MGTIIVKPEREKDEYVLWSTSADGPWFIGTREETLAELIESDQRKEQYARPEQEARLERTDLRSTSNLISGSSWDEDEQYIFQQLGLVKRSDIGKLCRELAETTPGWEERVQAMIEPFEHEED